MVQIVSPNLLRASENLSTLCCLSASEEALRAQWSANRKTLMLSVQTFALPWGFLRLKSDSSYLYLIPMLLFNSLNAPVSVAENMRLTRVRASTQPCFTLLETRNAAEVSLLSYTLASMPLWNWRKMAMNILGQPYFAMILHWPSLLINCVEGLGQINIYR